MADHTKDNSPNNGSNSNEDTVPSVNPEPVSNPMEVYDAEPIRTLIPDSDQVPVSNPFLERVLDQNPNSLTERTVRNFTVIRPVPTIRPFQFGEASSTDPAPVRISSSSEPPLDPSSAFNPFSTLGERPANSSSSSSSDPSPNENSPTRVPELLLGGMRKGGKRGEETVTPKKKRGHGKDKADSTDKKMKKKRGLDVSDKTDIACSVCGKKYPSWKALFGHMRAHPNRQWRGAFPPPRALPPWTPLEPLEIEMLANAPKMLDMAREILTKKRQEANAAAAAALGVGNVRPRRVNIDSGPSRPGRIDIDLNEDPVPTTPTPLPPSPPPQADAGNNSRPDLDLNQPPPNDDDDGEGA